MAIPIVRAVIIPTCIVGVGRLDHNRCTLVLALISQPSSYNGVSGMRDVVEDADGLARIAVAYLASVQQLLAKW